MQNLLFLFLLAPALSLAQTEVDSIQTKVDSVSEYRNGEKIYIITDNPARFPGGDDKFYKHIQQNLVYPSDMEGRVYISFIVNNDGSLSDFKGVKKVEGISPIEEEAIRVLKLMPNWIPATVGDQPVASKYIIPIRIHIK